MRRFLATTHAAGFHKAIINIKPVGIGDYEYRWEDQSLMWSPSDGKRTYMEHIQWMQNEGWKEVTSGIDPNDLQATCDHRKYDVATDSCQICGKDWNSILWSNGNKPCCGGVNSSGPCEYVGGKWHSADCDTLKPPLGLPEVQPTSVDYRPKPSYQCQCGAQATSNPNCHSTWCPDYKK